MIETQIEKRVTKTENQIGDLKRKVAQGFTEEITLEGSGDPNGVVTAVQGTFYWDSTNQLLWVNISTIGAPPEGTLWALIASSSGAIGWSRIEIDDTDSPYIAASFTVISCDTTAGGITVNLPTLTGRYSRIYDIVNNGTGLLTIDGNGAETISGSLTQVLVQYESLLIQAGTTEWDTL